MFWRAVILIGLMALWPSVVQAEEKRLALIMANEDYPASIGRLTNTHEDAATVAAALEQTGFQVTKVLDADEDGMEEALYEFEEAINAEAADGDEVIAFFYASMHGAAADVNGRTRNFLLPAKEEINSVGQLVRTGIRMDELLQGLSLTDAKAVLVISDACRNDMATSFTKSTTKGFVPEPTGPGMLIAYATAPGSTTPDDGLFAKTLAEEIVKPGRRGTIAIVDAIDRISLKRSFDGQPYFNPGGLPEWFCFADCDGPAAERVIEKLSMSETRDLQGMLNILGYEVGAPNRRLTEKADEVLTSLMDRSANIAELGRPVNKTERNRLLYEELSEAIEFNAVENWATGYAARVPDPDSFGDVDTGPYSIKRGENYCENSVMYTDPEGLVYQVAMSDDTCMIFPEDARDYDGDGMLDALFLTNPGGAATPSSYQFVSYQGNGRFQISEPMGVAWEQTLIPELVRGEWTVNIESVASNGAFNFKERYAWRNGKAVLIEGGATQPLVADTEFNFAPDMASLTNAFDLNGDGTDETIACDPWDRWSVLICSITDGATGETVNDIYEVQGGRVGILSTSTDGWRDLVVGNADVIRWNGRGYGEFIPE